MEYDGQDGKREALVGPADLETSTKADAGDVVVAVRGDVDLVSCDELRGVLDEAFRTSHDLTIDFSGLTFIDSSGLSVLVEAHRKARDAGGVLVLRNPTSMLRRLLDITRLESLLVVEPTDDNPPSDEA
jgi:anti-anti-sigma factor